MKDTNTIFADTSFTELFHNLTSDAKLLIREEVGLAKAEMSEKVSCYMKNVVAIAIGGFVAYAGAIVFLGALGIVVSFAFEKLGLDPLLAEFIGLGIVGLLVIAIGVGMLMKGKKALAESSLVPKKTIATLKNLKPGAGQGEGFEDLKESEEPKRSAWEWQKEALDTEERIGAELEEIIYRTSPAGIKDQTMEHMREHPYGWSLAAFAGGVVGSLLVSQKLKQAFGRS